ncbi:PucR family transcriptional regulator [Nocardia spumae]|uniref:PucR family transcriptional regulator n=1 Tax=Nocardia spumae TaxID=2887190 RepID=UPI001D133790|nr:helix-turn-helix domain-containing protein [Nocardia spumae]
MTTASTVGAERTTSGRALSLSMRDAHEMARELVAHLAAVVPPFTTLPADVLATEVSPMARLCVEWAVRRVAGGDLPERTDRLRAAAARWCRAGIPIEVVVHAVHEGFKAGLDLLFARARASDAALVIKGTATALELLDLITAAVNKAYVQERRADAAEHHTAVHTLTSALLGGHATTKLARECGIRIADRYFVLAVWIPPHPDETHPRLDKQVVARRKLRRVQAALAKLLRDNPLAMLSVDGGSILVPESACAEPDLDELFARLSELAGVPLTAAVVSASAAEVPAAAQQAHDLLDTVRRLGRGPGVHRFAELALQYQLTRPGIGRDILDARLAPLDSHPELLETLQVFFGTDLNRQRAARQLCIHPNTIDYRLRRIGQLTGFDPSRTTGLWYLRSALIARLSAGDQDTRRPA